MCSTKSPVESFYKSTRERSIAFVHKNSLAPNYNGKPMFRKIGIEYSKNKKLYYLYSLLNDFSVDTFFPYPGNLIYRLLFHIFCLNVNMSASR